jgi:large subunit ribosomal protein L17
MFAQMVLQESGPNTELGWLLYVFLGFVVLMVVVGWLTSRRKGESTDVPHEAHVVAEPVVQEVHIPHTGTLPVEEAVMDDLVVLEGIGPKVARILNDAGITTFAALADANPADIQRTLSAAGLQMMNPEGWIEQARLAANGEWVELEKLQSELKGGRRK